MTRDMCTDGIAFWVGRNLNCRPGHIPLSVTKLLSKSFDFIHDLTKHLIDLRQPFSTSTL
jgi:hypothetical protein